LGINEITPCRLALMWDDLSQDIQPNHPGELSLIILSWVSKMSTGDC